MIAPQQDNGFRSNCKVTVKDNEYHLVGTFHAIVPLNDTANPLDQVEKQIEHVGQQFKRHLCRATLEAADEQYVQLFKQTTPHLIRNGDAPFTIVTRFGEVALRRKRLLNTLTRKSFKPSALLWQTSQRRHITQQTIDAACDASQEVSYRKAAKQLADEAGEATLIAASTVWNKKQEKGKELAEKQNDFVQQVAAQKEVTPPPSVPSHSTRLIENDTIQVQLDEVKTKSQEDDKKWNLTYTATLETSSNECFYLAAKSSEELIQLVLAHFVVLGLYLGKRLEVVSDGASWIGDWVSGLKGVVIEHVLCWYHLRKRVYESLGALGLPKDRRKLLEREILGHLWRGRTAEAVWILWGVRPPSRQDQRRPNRIDELIGYLLRKKRMIVNYEARREKGLWLASTRVEKWNDSAIAARCKHNGMSWTEKGVLAVALYAAEKKHTIT